MDQIWASERRWRRQEKRWRPDTQWRYREREYDPVCWNADWILTEEIKVTKSENELWKRAKGQVIYILGKKSPLVLVECKGKTMRVLQNMYEGSTDRFKNVILLNIRDTELNYIELKTT